MTGACILIVCERQGIPCIVLYKEYRKWAPEGFYSVTGGSLKKGEDPILGAIRETEEESFLKFWKSDLKGHILVNNCYFWCVRFDKISRKEFLRKRFECPKMLRWEQKETWDLKMIPISQFRNIQSEYVKDIYGNEVKLRSIFFEEIKSEPRLLQLMESMFYQIPKNITDRVTQSCITDKVTQNSIFPIEKSCINNI